MAAVTYVVSTVVMGVLLVSTAVALARLGSPRGGQITTNRRYTPAGTTTSGSGGLGAVSTTVRRPAAWMAAFFVLVFGFGAGAVLLVGGFGVSPSPSVVTAVAGVFLAVLALYLTYGLYLSARGRGHPSAQAAAESVGALAMLIITGIALKLIVA